MISLKRNTKLELIPAQGVRVRKNSIYQPNQSEQFRISRGKFNDFLLCKRCFYYDRVLGLVYPDLPGWTLNETTDRLLKKEFDDCRAKQIPHRIFLENNQNNWVPFDHPEMDKWRDSLHHGLQYEFKNILLTGGVDDIWQDTETNQLILVDYKSQASSMKVETYSYLNSPYRSGYKIQMDFYAYLLKKMGFEVSESSYFLVCNADRDADGFHGKLEFSETLVEYKWNIDWIEEKLEEMLDTLNKDEVPQSNSSCMNCAYFEQRSKRN